jgi:hypothetical protein
VDALPSIMLQGMRMFRFIKALAARDCTGSQDCVACFALAFLDHLEDPPGPQDVGNHKFAGSMIKVENETIQ